MVDFADGLDELYKKLEEAAKFNVKKRSEITGAGAHVFAEVLKENTPVSSESYNKGRSVGHNNAKHGKTPRKTKHLKDSITYKEGFNHNKLPTGDTAVGFDSKYAALVGRFVNNGTRDMSPKELKNMHFFDRSAIEARQAVLKAEAERMKQL